MKHEELLANKATGLLNLLYHKNVLTKNNEADYIGLVESKTFAAIEDTIVELQELVVSYKRQATYYRKRYDKLKEGK